MDKRHQNTISIPNTTSNWRFISFLFNPIDHFTKLTSLISASLLLCRISARPLHSPPPRNPTAISGTGEAVHVNYQTSAALLLLLTSSIRITRYDSGTIFVLHYN
ncbi:hypothetical protein Hanom_Chr06g00505321 [Helianthus anomalus]